jgi:hypothetical protein
MKPMSGTAKFEGGRWVVRTLNGIEIGSCNGAPTFASALAAVGLSVEGAVDLRPAEDAEAYEWTVKPVEVSP